VTIIGQLWEMSFSVFTHTSTANKRVSPGFSSYHDCGNKGDALNVWPLTHIGLNWQGEVH
jgi:hypothetical protein